jgi:hypothetical protein
LGTINQQERTSKGALFRFAENGIFLDGRPRLWYFLKEPLKTVCRGFVPFQPAGKKL